MQCYSGGIIINDYYSEDDHIYDRDLINEVCEMFDSVMTFFDTKTGNNRMARRSDFTPSDFRKYLSNIALLEFKLDDEGQMEDAFCRLCGSTTTSVYGDLTGTWISDMEIQEAYHRVKNRHKIMTNKQQGLAVKSQILSKSREYVVVRVLYIPLSDDNKAIDKLLLFVDFVDAKDKEKKSF